MALSGSLSTMSVAELLQWASQGRKTGSLVISTGLFKKTIAFEKGELVYSSSSDPTRTLGQLLIRAGYLTSDEHERALQVRNECGVALGKVLLDLNAVSEDRLIKVMKVKLQNEIYDLFLCEDGDFEFSDSELPDLQFLPIQLDVTGAVLEVSRRVDEATQSGRVSRDSGTFAIIRDDSYVPVYRDLASFRV